jgi:O-methyltransferase
VPKLTAHTPFVSFQGLDRCHHGMAPNQRPPDGLPKDFDADMRQIMAQVGDFTMTSPMNVFALCNAVEYVTRHGIRGAVVESGVWRGGSMMAAALTLLRLGDTSRELVLFDTFDGMPQPAAGDVKYSGDEALPRWERERTGTGSSWCFAALDEVRRNLGGTGYPASRIHYKQGKVEATLPSHAPDEIAILRLDTDFYASTRAEMEHLFPRLVPGGVLIVDDYSHWQGCRRAVDEYLERTRIPLLLCRIDDGARIAVKPR